MSATSVNPLIAALHRQVRAVASSASALTLWAAKFQAKIHAGWRPPTEAQAQTGDYPKAALVVAGLPIVVETPAWTFRAGKGQDGKEWITRNWADYGYIPRTDGGDGEGLDVYVMPGGVDESARVYIVRQRDPRTGQHDEDKVMLGFPTKAAAVLGYLVHYDRPEYFGGITSMPMAEFKAFLVAGMQQWNAKAKYRKPHGE